MSTPEAPLYTIYVTNDNCPDYTWGRGLKEGDGRGYPWNTDEERTRQAFADLVRAHLDETSRTDGEAPENQNRYNMAVTQEAFCFVEHYPQRREELIRRIREGRVFVSPFFCNSMWAFQSTESAIRTLYPARRLERDWGIPIDVAEHIEEPSLPWGIASILAGCGVRWLSVPFLNYDSAFKELSHPPLFTLAGPDGEGVRVILDPWPSNAASYVQGSRLLRDADANTRATVEHYQALGADYPLHAILASGTHGDIGPRSGDQARGFADAIIAYNTVPGQSVRLANATLRQFCDAVDQVEAAAPFLAERRGCFGHSWDTWPVSLARYVAETRAGERALLAAEALLAIAATVQPLAPDATRADRERAEWYWTMLSDHAWNGSCDRNRQVNAALRRSWCEQLDHLARSLQHRGWSALGLRLAQRDVTLFNPLSMPRADLVRLEEPTGLRSVSCAGASIPAQVVEEEGERSLYFVSPAVAGFGLLPLTLSRDPGHEPVPGSLQATETGAESPFYRLAVDPATGGLASLRHQATGRELVVPGTGRSLGQTVYFDGAEHTLADVTTRVLAAGPVLARLGIRGTTAGVEVETRVTLYAALDQVDFDTRVRKPAVTCQERLCHVFPVLPPGGVLRVETTGAVIRPAPQPEGDLLPGANTGRFAVQGFVDASLPGGPGVTIAPLDAFLLRTDLGQVTFEALGNDQNYREVTKDQHGVTEFRFRYALRAHAGDYSGAEAFAWSRRVASPVLTMPGRLPHGLAVPRIAVDPERAVALCLKPAEGWEGCLLRLQETAGRSGPLRVGVAGFARAVRTDLLERDQEELPVRDRGVHLNLRAHGFAALRLIP